MIWPRNTSSPSTRFVARSLQVKFPREVSVNLFRDRLFEAIEVVCNAGRSGDPC
jgi:hypothetical protein